MARKSIQKLFEYAVYLHEHPPEHEDLSHEEIVTWTQNHMDNAFAVQFRDELVCGHLPGNRSSLEVILGYEIDEVYRQKAKEISGLNLLKRIDLGAAKYQSQETVSRVLRQIAAEDPRAAIT